MSYTRETEQTIGGGPERVGRTAQWGAEMSGRVIRVMAAAAVVMSGPAMASAAPPDSTLVPPDGTLVWGGGYESYTRFDLPFDLSVELESGDPTSPKVFERTEVMPGDGAELDDTDLVSNPADLAGAVSVEIDEMAGTLTVTVLEAGCVTRLGVLLSYDGPTTTIDARSDGLFPVDSPVSLSATSAAGTYAIEWTATSEACVDLGPVGSSAVFDYALSIIAYDVLGPDDLLPIAGGGLAVAVVAATMLGAGLLLRRAAARRPARPR